MTVTSLGLAKPASGRLLAMALFASIALNLALLGATGGFLWRHRFEILGGGTAQLAPNLLGYASTLPEERRKDLWGRTEEARQTMQGLRSDLRAARERTLQILSAEAFDPQAYATAQAHLLEADRKAREVVYRLYGEIAANLTAEERRGFPRWREQRRLRRNLLDEPQKQAAGQR